MQKLRALFLGAFVAGVSMMASTGAVADEELYCPYGEIYPGVCLWLSPYG
jgi:hypothetical protein